MDLLSAGKQSRVILLEIDFKWALIRIATPKTHRDKLIHISSVKGVSFQERCVLMKFIQRDMSVRLKS